ncbi:hypothetical protein AB0C33_35530 [Nonomuraea sp. NPDC048881]|uniref:hypothetical protein n=1 Tax=Nonomuraea sp. NPDC048881 TaxID=3155030 RepID=UPI0033D0AD30
MRESLRPFSRPALPGATDLTRRVLLAGTRGGALSLLPAACGAGGGAPLTGADGGAPQSGVDADAAVSAPPRRGGTLRAGSPPPPFSGHMLTKWTNGRLSAGTHRVVAGGSVTRRSTGVFWQPGLDTVIEPLAPFVGPEGSDYEPVLLWDQAKRQVEEYLEVFGRPDQVAAWREGRPYKGVASYWAFAPCGSPMRRES